MSLWSMNDGLSLSGTHTFTNGCYTQFLNWEQTLTEVKIGDVLTTRW